MFGKIYKAPKETNWSYSSFLIASCNNSFEIHMFSISSQIENLNVFKSKIISMDGNVWKSIHKAKKSPISFNLIVVFILIIAINGNSELSLLQNS